MTPARCRQRRRNVSCGDRISPVQAATVLKRQLSVLLAFGLLAGVATASSSTLSGTYKATITGKPAPLNGRWRLEFLPRGVVHVVRNGKLVVVGRATRIGTRRLKVSDRSGSYACSAAEGNGVYTYRAAGRRLTFRAVADRCIGRKLVFTTKPFIK
jgi:hypothetical protein